MRKGFCGAFHSMRAWAKDGVDEDAAPRAQGRTTQQPATRTSRLRNGMLTFRERGTRGVYLLDPTFTKAQPRRMRQRHAATATAAAANRTRIAAAIVRTSNHNA